MITLCSGESQLLPSSLDLCLSVSLLSSVISVACAQPMEKYRKDGRTTNKVKDTWNYSSHSHLGGVGDPLNSDGFMSGFSWPPKSYICSFCKREFRSAQALGGHMNVHRRDRARLRQSPPRDPPVLPNPNPSPSARPRLPNLNVTPPSCVAENEVSPVACSIPSKFPPLPCFPSSPSSSAPTFSAEPFRLRGEVVRSFFKAGTTDFMEENADPSRGVVRLELGVGMGMDLKENLDLELRLGYT